jgi:hypothetical protein
MRRNAQRPNALAQQPSITVGVARRSIVDAVRITVDLNIQPGGRTEEVQHIRPDRMLSAKLETLQLAASDSEPQHHLGR